MTDWHRQLSHGLRLGWDAAGATAAELDFARVVPVLAGGAFRAESDAPENG